MNPAQEAELAAALIEGIESLIKTFTAAKAGTLTAAQASDQINAAIAAQTTSLAADDAIADNAVSKLP